MVGEGRSAIIIAMPRFAANLGWLFTERPFLDRFAAARAAGFEGVEFAAPYGFAAAEIARRLEGEGLACVLFNLPMGDRARGDAGLACRPGRQDEFRAGVARALDYAAALRPTKVNCLAGVARPGEDPAALEALLLENLGFAAARFEAAGVPLVTEPLNDRDTPGFLLPRQEDGARIVALVGADRLGLQCDLYHVARMGDDASSILARHRGIIRHVQFADAPGRGEPGTGSVRLGAQVALLRRLGYDGWIAAEYKPTRATEETLAWMREFS